MTELRSTGAKIPPPLIYVTGFVAAYFLQRRWPLRWPHGRVLDVVALVFVLTGATLVFDFVSRFLRAQTTTNPFGTASVLITSGSYRFSRNPSYLGWIIAYIGVSILCFWIWPLVLLPLVIVAMDRLIIAKEERSLEAVFGDEYRAYAQHTRRWI